MQLCLINNDFKYELEKLIRIFLPFEKIEFLDYRAEGDCLVIAELTDKAVATLKFGEKSYSYCREIESINGDFEKDSELFLAIALFECLKECFNYTPQWGILTGVRPAKLFSRITKSKGIEFAENYFKNYLMVSDKKISLCKETIKGENEITSLSRPDSFSLYVSVPFCPSRCNYCSFVSHSVEQAKAYIPQYVELLCKELEITAEKAKANNLKLMTIYIGGGTPTTLSAEQLGRVMNTIKSSFDLSNILEYTVEAGRPDTITKEKLIAIKKGGATRISINPQTMNDSVLENIGRRHTAQQAIESFKLARECGFDNINMDLIAGLLGDSYQSFVNTVEVVTSLKPESVTVHSLSMKRASNLTVSGERPEIKMGKTASDMVDFAYNYLSENKISPYYMYRQSKTVGNLENVGYSKNGFECLYNVYIMDETHTILACGASAVTKLREPNGDKIERIFNFKYPYEYINRFDELMLRKVGIDNFYKAYPIN
ncbi:MAG: coproporphyrinogen dehydrogenase HemZ [Clostridia bacterium]|nr:coproporphyrinogen dehydrogenase HemZ [Clostridia bacterium]